MIRTFFGKPGVGKTTLAVKSAIKKRKLYEYCYCNFDVSAEKFPTVRSCTLDGIGAWTFPEHSYIALDEAGIEFNNRHYKSLPLYAIKWFKLHRHYKVDIDVFSQSFEDMDITLRRLSNELWYMYKVGPWTLSRRIYQQIMVDENTHQIVDGYKLCSPLWLLIWPLQLDFRLALFQPKWKLTFRPFYYRYFNSWAVPEGVPVKDFAPEGSHGASQDTDAPCRAGEESQE